MATSEGFSPRPKLVFAAPLQLGMLAEHELADLFLAERLTAPDLRERLTAGMPRGYRVVDLHDVWIGAPAIAPQLAAADYRMTLFHVEPRVLRAAAEHLTAADTLPRLRR
jgi:radical SAM-linked protein